MAHILIIDDDDLARMYLVAMLQNHGHRVMDVDSGKKCLEQLAAHQIDLIITDIFMPGMDGFELLAALQKLHPQGRMIAMSGGGVSMSRELALHAASKFGAMDLIDKPFRLKEVLAKVNRALNSRTACQDEPCGT